MPRPFIDRPLEDLAAARRAASVAAEEWRLPPPELVRSSMNATFTAGDLVLRVGRPTARPGSSIALHRVLETQGLRVPRPALDEVIESNGLAVTAWERIAATTDPVDWREVGEMVAVLHQMDPVEVPAGYPLTTPGEIPWWDFDTLLAGVRDEIDDAALAGIEDAIARGTPRLASDGALVVCHGDVHPGNVVSGAGGPVLLDWDLLALAPRGWDHGPLMTWQERWGGEPIYEDFAGGYGWSGRSDPEAEAFAELRLVAATLMRVHAARFDPAAAPEAALRLRFWRGDARSPAWTAQ